MRLLKLVIVDDEPILLEGLIKTYDWKGMGFEVVGSARNGEQAIEIIKEKRPHVVLTDIRMKQISGLMVMEEIEKENINCLFIVLSAYRDFEYAQQACDLGAFAYLLKPVDDEKLKETMRQAWKTCTEQIKNEEKYSSWQNLMIKDSYSFLQVIVQKYVQGNISEEKTEEVFRILGSDLEEEDRFITVCTDLDLTYKITHSLDYEAARFALIQLLEEKIREQFYYWKFENDEGNFAFIIKTGENSSVKDLKQILEFIKNKEKQPVLASISKPYKGIHGIKRSYTEARKLFELASMSGASAFTLPEETDDKADKALVENAELSILNAVRRNDDEGLKAAFVQFIYGLPKGEEVQCGYIHRVMVRAEFAVEDSYGMTEELKKQFQNYYRNMQNLTAAKAVDVCYKILCRAIRQRKEQIEKNEMTYFKDYMSEAVAYIEEHLNDEGLSIVSVAEQVYLNPVYFGRVFKNTFHMTFKKYLMKKRMEKARELLEGADISIGDICERVGIGNPSYFSHLFKEYTGKLPSEYKKESEL